MMRRTFLTVVAASLAATLAYSGVLHAAPAAPAAEPSVAGLWEQFDDHGHSWFLFFEHDGVYEGAVVKMYLKPFEPPNPICAGCTGDQKNAPVLGLVIVKNMQRHGLAYENGKIIDPRNGNVYDAKMKISPDGQRLTLRGFLGIDLFGQDQVWKRLPDDALAPNDLPPNLLPYLAAAQGQPDNRFISGGGAPKTTGSKTVQPSR
jgi:uncharacterized protein (DUF2147 family)